MKKLFSILLLPFIFSTCLFNNDDCWTDYKFEIPSQVTPASDTFYIGDTIWFSSEINSLMVDINSNQELDVSDFPFPLEVTFGWIEQPEVLAGQEFDFVGDIGYFNVVNAGAVIRIGAIYEIETNQRKLRVGIVPKTVGGFYFSLANLNHHYENINLTNSDCVEDMDLIYNMNNGSDNHYYLIEEGPSPFLNLERWKEVGGYAFWVTE